MLVGELCVLIVCLLNFESANWQTFGIWSLYTQWLLVLFCAAICTARRWLVQQAYFLGLAGVVLAFLLSLAAVELTAMLFFADQLAPQFDWLRLCRVVLAGLVALALVIRFFGLLSTLESRNQAESQARIQALQSRIQPHFLFNSLNTISELAAKHPDSAEKAIQALSMLFRVSLEEGNSLHSLTKELRLCERYIELERWRIGDRIAIVWQVDVGSTDQIEVPKLLLQPLIENALKYSAESSFSNKVEISISIKETTKYLSIKIVNPVSQDHRPEGGHGIAISNIRERLSALYDDQQSFKVRRNLKQYQVIMRIPK